MSTQRTSSIKQIVFWGLVVFLVIAMINLTRGLMELRQASKRVEEAEMELVRLEEEKAQLEGELAWRSSEAYVEQEIRNQLKMARPGETVVIVDEKAYANVSEEEERVETEEEWPNWRKWWELFR